jgi:hypothetical protein
MIELSGAKEHTSKPKPTACSFGWWLIAGAGLF